MLGRSPLDGDGKRVGSCLRDAHHHGIAEAAKGADVLTLRRDHVHDVGRQAPEHAHGKVEAIGHRDIDVVSHVEGDRLHCLWLP
jgi:hypothetical protein